MCLCLRQATGGPKSGGPCFLSLLVAAPAPERQKDRREAAVRSAPLTGTCNPLPPVTGLRVALHMTFLLVMALPLVAVFLAYCMRAIPRQYWHNALSCALVKAGPTFIKLGQWIATRPDLFSPELCTHLGGLFSDSPVHSFAETEAALRRELGPDCLSEVFEWFEAAPLHSGCIAQVHRAKLRASAPSPSPAVAGHTEGAFSPFGLLRWFWGPPAPPKESPSIVAVKVVHPSIRDRVAADLGALWAFMTCLKVLPGAQWLGLEDALQNFSDTLTESLDMEWEARHLQRFNELFAGDTEISFSKVVLSRPSVLVQTFEEGEQIATWIPSASMQDRRIVADLGLRGFLQMLFRHNYIHSDLHPGNILVATKADGSPRIVFLDTGMVTELTDAQWVNFVELYACVIAGDGERAADLMVERAPAQACSDRPGFQQAMSAIIEKYNKAESPKDIHIGDTLLTILNTIRTYKVGLESDFASLVVSIIILDGLGRSLQPDICVVSRSRPYVVQWLFEHPSMISELIPRILSLPQREAEVL